MFLRSHALSAIGTLCALGAAGVVHAQSVEVHGAPSGNYSSAWSLLDRYVFSSSFEILDIGMFNWSNAATAAPMSVSLLKNGSLVQTLSSTGGAVFAQWQWLTVGTPIQVVSGDVFDVLMNSGNPNYYAYAFTNANPQPGVTFAHYQNLNTGVDAATLASGTAYTNF
ncbi:MAG: hypothetical protein ACOVT5_11860, partial [Armatimonadaceae bacterium]